MGHGKKLNKGKIETISKIAKSMKRRWKVLYNLLKNVNNYGPKKSSGRPLAISIRETRAVLSTASNSYLIRKLGI